MTAPRETDFERPAPIAAWVVIACIGGALWAVLLACLAK